MKKTILINIILFLSFCGSAQNTDSRLYELRTYYTENGRMPALINRFANHTTRLFEKHGMTNVGYWVANADSNKLVYILSYPDLDSRNASWKAFMADPDWQAASKESEKDGKILSKVESVYMKMTDFSPNLKTPDIKSPSRTFDLRTYTMLPGRFPNILERFRNHTTKIFEKHGMTNIAYWTTDEKDGVQPKLIYILAHQSEASAKASFDAFRVDPEWVKVKTESEKEAKITEKVETFYMTPLEFSKIK